jgi:diguanylate cyclase (GGDEF)-like protein
MQSFIFSKTGGIFMRRRRHSDKKAIVIEAIANTLKSALWTTPFVILAGALLIFWQGKQISEGIIGTLASAAYFILGLGMSLTFWFNRSRVFFILLILFISLFGLTAFPADNIRNQQVFSAIYSLTSLLIPANLLFFFFLPERGILSIWGKRHFGIVFFQILFVSGIVSSRDQDLVAQLNSHLFTLPDVLRTPLPDAAVLLFAFVTILLCIKRHKGTASFKPAVLGSLSAATLGLHFQATNHALPLFYAAAGLILTLSVIKDSYSMAYVDELTELLSRRALNEELLRLSGKYVIAMVDVDHFKKFNDTYGHDAGDDVLRLIASLLKKVTGGGKAFRYGGEEFTILFPGKSIDEIMSHLESLHKHIAKHEFTLRKSAEDKSPRKKLSITISIGVAENGEKHKNPHEVLKEADAALYRAKEKGRNRISI